MDENNYLTPSKIMKLLHLAEDKSTGPRTILNYDEATNYNLQSPSQYTGESSGILDLDRLKGFGETSTFSAAFNPGEMTGRSTEQLEDVSYSRHSVGIESLTNTLDKQSQEVNKILRQKFANSFSSKANIDLSADEREFIKEKLNTQLDASTTAEMLKDLPQSIVNVQDTSTMSNFNMSERAVYFKERCPNFSQILKNTESPDKYMRPSISEVSSHMPIDVTPRRYNTYVVDQNLDQVPVRQPKPTALIKPSDQTSCDTENSIMSDMGSYFNNGPSYSVPQSRQGHNKIAPSNIMLSNFTLLHEDTDISPDESISRSKIAEFLNRESSIGNLYDIKHLTQIKPKKKPLIELQKNAMDNEVYVTKLKDTKRTNSASSSSTLSTVVSMKNLNISEKVPEVIVTADDENRLLKTSVRSKSPSSRSQSTLSTVQENKSFKTSNSPLHSSKESEANTSHIPSPNVAYKELDSSVDWQEVLQLKQYNEERFGKAQWIDVVAMPVQGYVGIKTPVTINITTRVDSWLTAKFEFLQNTTKDVTIELPRQPFLLSPGKNDKLTLTLTCINEMTQILPFCIHLKDSTKDASYEHKDAVEINIKMPPIQSFSRDGMNKVIFPIVSEGSSVTKYFVIISDCPGDLQLELSTASELFMVTNVQEIKNNEINKVLMETNWEQGRAKTTNQVCRLSKGKAVKVTVVFTAPKLSDLKIHGKMATFNAILNISMIGMNVVLNKVDLVGTVGVAQLEVKADSKIHLGAEPTAITVYNTGSMTGAWVVKFKSRSGDAAAPFEAAPANFELPPAATRALHAVYTGPPDVLREGYIIFEEVRTLASSSILISGGSDKSKLFPIKTNLNNISWVKAGKKELSLKNSTNSKIQIRCHIVGEGFYIESCESRAYMMSLGPCECRPLSIVFAPGACTPHVGALHLVLDKSSDFSRKVKLHGCGSGEPVRWSGLVTYGETALVRAVLRRPIELSLYNRASVPAFICASVQFNLQYRCLSGNAELQGARRVVGHRGRHAIVLRVDWPRLERRARAVEATTLATVTVLTGPEFTRRRILKILRDQNNGQLDASLLPPHLKVLVQSFDGEDSSLDRCLDNFNETKASLNELVEGLQELTAQIDVPRDSVDDNTVLISDDAVLEHHTLCE